MLKLKNIKIKNSLKYFVLAIICWGSNILVCQNINKNENINKRINKVARTSKVIIWDLGNTLIRANYLPVVWKIGIKDIFLNSLFHFQRPSSIKSKSFNILDSMNINNKVDRKYWPTDQDSKLPELMCNWLEGTKTGVDICKEVKNFLDKSTFTKSKRQKRIIQNSINAIFDPKVLSSNMSPIKSVARILECCANNNHKLFILSNFDSDTFEYLKKSEKNKIIFKFFDPKNIVISGDVGFIKPDPKIYNYILNKFKLNPKDCIFIDDQLENIKAAQKLGIKSILFKSSKQLKKELKSLKVI